MTTPKNFMEAGAASVGAGLVAGTAELAISGSVTNAIVVGAAAAAPAGLRKLLEKVSLEFATMREDRQTKYFQAVLEDETMTLEAYADQLDGKPKALDVIMRTLRAAMDAPDEACVRPLAMLAKEYRREVKHADAFFRAAVRFLVELDEEELRDVTELFQFINTASDTAEEGWVVVRFSRQEGVERDSATVTAQGSPLNLRHGLRVARLLERHGLAVGQVNHEAAELRIRTDESPRMRRILHRSLTPP